MVAAIPHIAMGIALWISDIPSWLALLGSLVIVLHFKLQVFIYALHKHKRSVLMLCKDCDKWQYMQKNGQIYLATLVPERSYKSHLILILYMQHFFGNRYILVPRDSVSLRDYRFLAYHISL